MLTKGWPFKVDVRFVDDLVDPGAMAGGPTFWGGRVSIDVRTAPRSWRALRDTFNGTTGARRGCSLADAAAMLFHELMHVARFDLDELTGGNHLTDPCQQTYLVLNPIRWALVQRFGLGSDQQAKHYLDAASFCGHAEPGIDIWCATAGGA